MILDGIKQWVRYVSLVVIAIAGGTLSVAAFCVVCNWDRQRAQAQFHQAAANRCATFRRELESDLSILESVQAFHIAGERVLRSAFRDFTRLVLANRRSIQALEWIPRVPSVQRESYEASAERDGFAGFQITERDAQGKLIRAGPREEYFPVYFVEPYEGNETALGYDLGSNPTRLEALQHSRETSRTVATARIRLVQETSGQYGFLVFAPVYRKGAPTDSERTRRENLEGFALGVFRIPDILEQSLTYLEPEGVDVCLHDETAPANERFLYFHNTRITKTAVTDPDAAEADRRPDLKHIEKIDFAGREWSVVCTPAPGYLARRRTWHPWGVLASGLLFTGLWVGYLLVNLHRSEQIKRLVRERTQELDQANVLLSREIAVRRQAEEELRRINRALRTLSACNEALVRAENEAELLGDLCAGIVDIGGYRLAWVGFVYPDEHKTILPVAQAGFGEGLVGAVATTWGEAGRGSDPIGLAIRSGKPCVEKNILSKTDPAPWRAEASKRGYASLIALPLVAKGQAFGALSIYAKEPDAFDRAEVELLSELADDMTYGITALRTRLEHQKAEETLLRAKQELEAKVAERTADLKATNAMLEARAAELEEHNRQTRLLGQLGEFLQICQTVEEAYPIVAQIAGQLFLGDSGALFVYGPSRNLLETACVWGEQMSKEKTLNPEECQTLQLGRPIMGVKDRDGPRCRHAENAARGYLCAPMTAQNEALGVVHLLLGSRDPAWAEEQWLEAKQRLVMRVADLTGLALTNLKLRETLRNLSIRDPLTGLFNRRFMEEAIERERRRCERKSAPLGIVMLDLDHFKKFNDAYGHEAGNNVLRKLGAFLQENVRGSDIACRYGGEEFLLILPETSLETTLRRAEHLREGAGQLRVPHNQGFLSGVTLSVGVAIYPQHGSTAEGVLQMADEALYRAKRAGRNRVCTVQGTRQG